jgi:GntR family transcriptional regulator
VLTSWLIPSLGLRVDDDFSASLYALLAQRGATPTRADQLLDATNATPHLAALLEVPRRTALLVVTRVTYDAAARPIEYVVGHYRADRYRYSMHLTSAETPAEVAKGLITV